MNQKIIRFPNTIEADPMTHYKCLAIYRMQLDRAMLDAIKLENMELMKSAERKIKATDKAMEGMRRYFAQQDNKPGGD